MVFVVEKNNFRAIAGQYDVHVVTGLSKRLETDPDAKRKLAYADALTRVYKKPGPWKYWGYRPGPKPANRRCSASSPATCTAR